MVSKCVSKVVGGGVGKSSNPRWWFKCVWPSWWTSWSRCGCSIRMPCNCRGRPDLSVAPVIHLALAFTHRRHCSESGPRSQRSLWLRHRSQADLRLPISSEGIDMAARWCPKVDADMVSISSRRSYRSRTGSNCSTFDTSAIPPSNGYEKDILFRPRWKGKILTGSCLGVGKLEMKTSGGSWAMIGRRYCGTMTNNSPDYIITSDADPLTPNGNPLNLKL